MLYDCPCKTGRLQVDETTVQVMAPFKKLVWSVPREAITWITQQHGAIMVNLTIHTAQGVYAAHMVSKPNAEKFLALFPDLEIQATGKGWYHDPMALTHVATYTNERQMQQENERKGRSFSKDNLSLFIELLRERNALDERIANLMGRPVTTGHIGEYIASCIFGITLEGSASNKGYDGRFSDGPLAGRTVDIKCYTKQENIIDLPKDANLTLGVLPNYYLVLTGAKLAAISSRGTHRPLVIESIYLFEAMKLVRELNARASKLGRQIKFGLATSVPKQFWDGSEIYPVQKSNMLVLTSEQKSLLASFH